MILQEPFEVSIYDMPEMRGTGIWVFRHIRGEEWQAAAPVELKWIDAKTGEDTKPFLFLPQRLSGPFFQSMAEELAKRDIKTRPTAMLEGTNEAMQKHLNDMRAIAFKCLKMKGATQ